MKKLLIAIALISPTLASADDDIEKALRHIDAEQARIFQMEFEDAKRMCDEYRACIAYRIKLEEAAYRIKLEEAGRRLHELKQQREKVNK